MQTHAEQLPQDRARALGRLKFGDAGFRLMTFAAALVVLLLLLGVAISLFIGAWPALPRIRLRLLHQRRLEPAEGAISAPRRRSTARWSPRSIAMLIGVPVGLGIAVFLTELCPPSLRRPIGIAIELLAGIPSIIYGMWGFYYLGRSCRPMSSRS